MTELLDPIPDDLVACQERLRAVLGRLRDLERQLDEFVATTEELQRSYACLKEEYLALKRLLFGPRRERLPEAPGSNIFSTPIVLSPSPRNPRIKSRVMGRPRIVAARATADGKSPAICRGRKSDTTSRARSGFALAAARRRKSARMSPSNSTTCQASSW